MTNDGFKYISAPMYGVKHIRGDGWQDYNELKAALLDLGRANYENIRAKLIGERGYDGFRTLQNEVFKEIGTIKFEQSQA